MKFPRVGQIATDRAGCLIKPGLVASCRKISITQNAKKLQFLLRIFVDPLNGSAALCAITLFIWRALEMTEPTFLFVISIR